LHPAPRRDADHEERNDTTAGLIDVKAGLGLLTPQEQTTSAIPGHLAAQEHPANRD
jgi:hypothetical protein